MWLDSVLCFCRDRRFPGSMARGTNVTSSRATRDPKSAGNFGCAVNRPESSANVNGNACFCLYPDFCNHECEGGVMEKAQPLSLLRETDFAHQFGVTRIG